MDLSRIPLKDIQLGRRIGSGSHSHAHQVGAVSDNIVAIVLRQHQTANEPAISDHFEQQVAYMQRIRDNKIVFRNRLVSPEIHRFIINHSDIIVGYLMEYIPGEDLRDFAARKDIGRELRSQAIGEAREHLLAIHSAGYVHGDPNPGNVRIEMSGDVLHSRWFDFEMGRSPERPDYWYGPENDLEIFERNAIALRIAD